MAAQTREHKRPSTQLALTYDAGAGQGGADFSDAPALVTATAAYEQRLTHADAEGAHSDGGDVLGAMAASSSGLTNAQQVVGIAAGVEDLQGLAQATVALASQAYAPHTRRAYAGDFERFGAWCTERGYACLPASAPAVGLYLTHLVRRGRKLATIQRALTTISQAHIWAGHGSLYHNAEVRTLLQGIKRELGFVQRRKAPLLPDDLRKLMAHADVTTLTGLRDRAMLLLGFAGGLRRSEIVAIDFDDLAEVKGEGLCVHITRGKTDPHRRGRDIGIPFGNDVATCPVRALRAWLEISGVRDGAVFVRIRRHETLTMQRLTEQTVALCVKRYASLAGMDIKKLAAHSLRAGLVTAAAQAGKAERDIMRQTGHSSVLVLRQYIRRANLFSDNAASDIGL